MNRQQSHEGTIESVNRSSVTVKLGGNKGCSACALASCCTAESLPSGTLRARVRSGECFSVGERVTVRFESPSLTQRLALHAVAPLLLIAAGAWWGSEDADPTLGVAVATVLTAVYVLLLRLTKRPRPRVIVVKQA